MKRARAKKAPPRLMKKSVKGTDQDREDERLALMARDGIVKPNRRQRRLLASLEKRVKENADR